MDQREQQMAFQDELNAMVERYSQEFDMTYVSIVGVLELQKLEIADFLFSSREDDDYE
jgi:Mg2+/Co2+ transporter CorB